MITADHRATAAASPDIGGPTVIRDATQNPALRPLRPRLQKPSRSTNVT